MLKAFAISIIFVACLFSYAYPKDDGRYANSPLKSWFDSLKSDKGLCCSFTDGAALADVDWESHEGHYRVRIDGRWWDVPDEAVLTQPNRDGRTIVWPVYYNPNNIQIRCFIVGAQG